MGNAAKNKKNKMKNFFTNFWPIIFIFLVWFIFSSPYFLKGKAPFSATYQLNNFAPWSAYSEFAGPVKNGAMPDVITQIYPWKNFTIETLKSGQIPLWNPYSFSGNPHLANYQSAVLSPFNILFFVLPFKDAWSILILLQPLAAGLFTYLMMRSFNVSRFGSAISSIAFMFCGFVVVWMAYGTLAFSIIFLPLAFYAIRNYLRKKNLIYLVLLTLTFPLSFFSGHFQISLYFFLFVLAFAIFNTFKETIKTKATVIGFILLGVALCMPQLIPSWELYANSVRSTRFILSKK